MGKGYGYCESCVGYQKTIKEKERYVDKLKAERLKLLREIEMLKANDAGIGNSRCFHEDMVVCNFDEGKILSCPSCGFYSVKCKAGFNVSIEELNKKLNDGKKE